MILSKVMTMLFESGNHVVKVTNDEYSELVYRSDWESGKSNFDGDLWVRSVIDDYDDALIVVRVF